MQVIQSITKNRSVLGLFFWLTYCPNCAIITALVTQEVILMTHKLAISLVATFIALAGCGGGGSSPAVAGPIDPPAEVLSQLSYENRHRDYQYYSSETPLITPGSIDARAFFKYKDGSDGFVAQQLISGPWNTPDIGQAQPGTITFFKKVNGVWQNNNVVYDQANSVRGCIHPRKIAAADYNNDGAVDFAISCHGWDAPPYPGERGTILLSQADGRYQLRYLSDDIDFKHGLTSIDINKDGNVDLIVTAMNGVNVFINNGTGYFTKSTTYTIPQVARAFHVEAVDLTGDGQADFVVGSHEWESPTKIIVNRGDNDFGGALFNRPTEITIPAVPNAGVIVDFLHVKSNNSLYILRTGGSASNDPNFYKGMWLQKFTLDTKISTVVYANADWFDPSNPNRKWHTWILEKDGYIVSDYGTSFRVRIE